MNEIKEVKTHYNYEIACDECDFVLDSEKCDGCSSVLFESADFRIGDKIIHVETEDGYLHFCSKECAEEFLKSKKEAAGV